jgi:carboxymethylenebutenolidase
MRIHSEVPTGAEKAPGVVVIMHGPGLDRFIEDRVADLARHGYAAAAPDLYHRQPADGADMMTRIGRVRDDEILADIDAAVAHLRALDRPRVTELAVLGFCMGGRHAYLAAGARPALWRAAGVFYGGKIMKAWGDGPSPFELHRYEGAGHAFLNFTNAERHRPAQAQDAWRKLRDFLGRHLS